MPSRRIAAVMPWLLGAVISTAACSPDDTRGVSSGAGGVTSSGGAAASSGGATAGGSINGNGGSSTSGGAAGNGGSSGNGGASTSGGATAGGSINGNGGSSASGGASSNGGASTGGGAPSSGGAGPVDRYTLVVDAPASGATVQGNGVVVRGRGPGFLNVEVWDPSHSNPPLGRATPAADGSFTVTIDASNLTRGATTWTVHAWDSTPGTSFQNHGEVAVPLTVGGPPVVVQPGGPGGDPGMKWVPAGYTLKFSDEFTASSVDTGKWNTLAPWGVPFYDDSHQKQAFIPSAVSLSGGLAVFTADRSKGNTNGQPYSSGSLTTNGTFTHGYFEARVKVPKGKGYWPAFWLTSKDRWPPEWDIFEIIDDDVFGYTHPVSGGRCSWIEGTAGPDATIRLPNLYDTWHVYGFRWTSSDLYWYIDGTMTEHYSCNTAAGTNDPMWLNVSFQIGGDWPGDPDGNTPFPARMETDYVRVYQQ